eukprot:6157839-Amphidinium_carterae.1
MCELFAKHHSHPAAVSPSPGSNGPADPGSAPQWQPRPHKATDEHDQASHKTIYAMARVMTQKFK